MLLRVCLCVVFWWAESEGTQIRRIFQNSMLYENKEASVK